ncbi:MAG: oligosaccharide flippase family protein, partial [Chloroflexi bacterium]|nr:oligosaccharide flippase family protein [Chloroflexota bacterium]
MTDADAAQRTDLARRAIQGAGFLAIAQYGTLAIGIVRGALLLRLVAPEFHGTVFAATALVSFFNLFRLELREIVVTTPAGDQARLTTQYLLEVGSSLLGFGVAGLTWMIAPQFSGLLDRSSLVWPAIWILLGVRLASALSSTPLYILHRDIRQGIITSLTLIAALLSLIVGVGLALAGYPLLAVLADVAILPLVLGLGAWLAAGWRPGMQIDQAAARDILGFSFALWTTGLLGKITFEFDDLLVGEVNGPAILGFYGRAYALAKLPMDVFTGMIGSLGLALYAQSLAGGMALLERSYALTTWLLTRLIAVSSIVM